MFPNLGKAIFKEHFCFQDMFFKVRVHRNKALALKNTCEIVLVFVKLQD